ncbi:MAG TPA: hypothetical protein VFV73_29955 [Streptosporangiaceae bacterium]|nr:hypothetical protein [Streptosporangiaceae bacterium]
MITALGGYRVNRLPFYLVRWQRLPHNAPAAWKVLQVFGADFAGLHGIWLDLLNDIPGHGHRPRPVRSR